MTFTILGVTLDIMRIAGVFPLVMSQALLFALDVAACKKIVCHVSNALRLRGKLHVRAPINFLAAHCRSSMRGAEASSVCGANGHSISF